MTHFYFLGSMVKTARRTKNNYFSDALTVTQACDSKKMDVGATQYLHPLKSYQRSYAPTDAVTEGYFFGETLKKIEHISSFHIRGGPWAIEC